MGKEIQLNIQTVPVKIKILEVDGKKMTLAVFRQIPEISKSEMEDSIDDIDVIGWVSHGDKSLILSWDGILYKSTFKQEEYQKTFKEINYNLGKKISNYEAQILRERLVDNQRWYKEDLFFYKEFFDPEKQIYIAI